MSTRRRDDPDRAHAVRVDPPEYKPDDVITDEDRRCPDEIPGNFEVSGRFFEARFTEGQIVRNANGTKAQRTFRVNSRRELEQRILSVRGSSARLRESVRLREDGGVDWFGLGLTSAPYLAGNESALTRQYIPLIPGPATRQQYWADYFATSAKCFEAYSHDPIAHRAVELVTEFTLGRGVEARAKSDAAQTAWDDFCKLNNMEERFEQIAGDLSVFGEIFLRYFEQGPDLIVRSLDPATIYEIVSDQEDNESVYFYHQQYQTRTELYAPPKGNIAPQGPTDRSVTKFIIRQIPADEIDHVKVNVRSAEVRGRPDLFPSLGYLKRLRDLLTSRVIKADMQARMIYLISAAGNAGDLTALKNSLFPNGQPPAPGTALAVNQQVKVEGINFALSGDPGVDGDIEGLINLIAVGMGVPKQYIGIEGRSTRASSLVATEPAAKRFEDRQKVLERLMQTMAQRVFEIANIPQADREIEFIFPTIATEDRSAKLKDLAFAESNNWIAKRTAATIAAKELDNTTYDYDDEQTTIAKEFTEPGNGIKQQVISSSNGQTTKTDPTVEPVPEQFYPKGEVVDPATGAAVGAPAGPMGAGQQTRGGFPADENPLSKGGAANIKKDAKLSESGELIIVAMREAARIAREPRRRPDDPQYQEHSTEYRQTVEAELRELVRGIHPQADVARLTEAVRELARRDTHIHVDAAPHVEVHPPPVRLPDINVAAPEVHVAPEITLPAARRRRVERAEDGTITAVVDE